MSSSNAGILLDNGPEPVSQDHGIMADPSAAALRLAGDVQRALAGGRSDVQTPEAQQALVAAACRAYSVQTEAGIDFLPLPDRSPVMDTDVMVFTSALLRAVNLQVFELGMWQSWTGR
jgi:hypothetical protein